MASILRPSFSFGSRPSRFADEEAPLRCILHVDLDCFFVSVERVLDPSLAQAPVIVGGLPEARGVVTSASREARATGVHAGMPSAVARRLCPEARFLPGRGRLYARAASAAQRILRESSPHVERASIDEAWLDVSEQVRERAAVDIAADIQASLADRLGLPCSIGIGSNKLISKVACRRAKPEGIVEIWPGYERTFLGPLAVGELPGVGPVLQERLRLFGLRTVSDLARVDVALLEATFGAMGRHLADMALGLDDEELRTSEAPRSVARERTFARDVADPDALIHELYVLAGTVAARLKQDGMRGRTVTIKMRSADFRTTTRARTISRATDDAGEIAGIACFLLRDAHRGEPLRLVGIQVSGLVDEPAQGELFAPSAPEAEAEAAVSAAPREPGGTPEARIGGLTLRWHPRA